MVCFSFMCCIFWHSSKWREGKAEGCRREGSERDGRVAVSSRGSCSGVGERREHAKQGSLCLWSSGTAADHPGAWRGVDHVDHPRARRCMRDGPRHLGDRGGLAWEHGYHLSLLTSAHGEVTDHGQTA